jgi:hypothetical protein
MADAQLCGSVNLESADAVFAAIADISGATVHRVPDGETGERQQWIMAQMPRFAANPHFERPAETGFAYGARPNFRLREGVTPEEATFDIGYAAEATASYPLFRRLRDEGAFAPDTRFQVSLPTQMAIVGVFIDPEQQAALAPVFERALAAEIAAILETVPAQDLALQWDVAVEFSWLEGGIDGVPAPKDAQDAILAQLVRLGELVPDPVELGYHLCYGDAPDAPGDTGKHFKQPENMSKLVLVANGIVDDVHRRVDWIHMPVPIERDDDAYFAPLADLRLPPQTRLFLGLVHWQDGVAGTQRRIDTAARHASGFGVATECGMGRRPREVVPSLLEIQRDVTVPAA